MGIRGLSALIKSHAPNAIHELTAPQIKRNTDSTNTDHHHQQRHPLKELFPNATYYIDTAIYVHKFAYGVVREGIVPHVAERLVALDNAIKRHSGIPVFVFDGDKPNSLKEFTQKKRASVLSKAQERHQQNKTRYNAMITTLPVPVLDQTEQTCESSQVDTPRTDVGETPDSVETQPQSAPAQEAAPDMADEDVRFQSEKEEAMKGAKEEERVIDWFFELQKAKQACLKSQNISTKPTKMDMKNIRLKLEELGLKTIQSNDEGEKLCAKLSLQDPLNSIVLTEDFDALVFGCKIMMRGVSLEYLLSNGYNYDAKQKPQIVRLDQILASLKFTYEQFVDMCVLMGSDFTREHLKGFGPKKCLDEVKKHGTIENICQKLCPVKHPEKVPFTKEAIMARNLFMI